MKTYCEWKGVTPSTLLDASRLLCIAPQHNTTKPDATGAFQPEARAMLRYYGGSASSVVLIDNRAEDKAQRNAVRAALAARRGSLRGLAVFCHGFASGIQFKFRLPQIDSLAQSIVAAAESDIANLRIALYACDTAKDVDPSTDDVQAFGGDGGFADKLRDAICAASGGAWQGWIDAHTTAGHTTRNPHIRRFDGQGTAAPKTGGSYIVPAKKGEPTWVRWREAIIDTSFRYEAPFLSTAEIHQYLAASS